MSDAESTLAHLPSSPGAPGPRPRLKKLRLLVVLVPLSLLALVSTIFGLMMAVAADLPALENEPRYQGQGARNSELTDVFGTSLGRLASDDNRLFVRYEQVSSFMRSAIIAVEDERYLTNNGVDLRGIGRAFVQDVIQRRAAQGGSTITQQFVKNALQAQDERTVFQKLRESALAYHLTRKWGKQKILQEYLNSIYFGNGAYGIESAAQTYFGQDANHEGCGDARRPCAQELKPHEAALLAGMVASPSLYDPEVNPQRALRRRDLVLRKMLEQRYLTRSEYADAVAEGLPGGVRPPTVDSEAPHFTTWVRQQLVDRFGAQRAFEGGLRVRTTLDLKLQRAAEKAVRTYLPGPDGPTAALVAIDNGTGAVRAMVSGTDPYADRPFNLATQGQRQPGSAMKPFILAQALRAGYGPGSVWPSKKSQFCIDRTRTGCREAFVVNNFEDAYAGQRTLAQGLTFSDNSVYATAGIKLGTKKVARLAERMGIRTPVSSNLAMTLGGLQQGVTPLDLAHAYETFQTGGLRVTGTLGAPEQGPVGVAEVRGTDGKVIDGGRNRVIRERVIGEQVARTTTQIMSTVVSQGSGARAALPGIFTAGKTGTTENSGDAWFVGFTDRLTVAVWVGYPDELTPMETEFRGEPVTGGTFPALIWRDFQLTATELYDRRNAAERERKGLPPEEPRTVTTPPAAPSVPDGTEAAPAAPAAEAATGGAQTGGAGAGGTGDGGTGDGATGDGTGGQDAAPAPAAPAPATPAQPAPAPPAPAPAPAPAAPAPAPAAPAPAPAPPAGAAAPPPAG